MARKVNEIVSAGIAQKMSLQGGDGFHMHPPADETRNGFMTVEDRKLLNTRTSNATPNSLMIRDGNGRAKVSAPSAPDDIARKQEVDDLSTRVNRIIADGDSSAEVVDARGNYPVLSARLDAADSEFIDRGINVKDFGALGDGTTDDTSAIQAAIDFASARGGGLVLCPPTLSGYLIAGELILKRFVWLEGSCYMQGDKYNDQMTNVSGTTFLVTGGEGVTTGQTILMYTGSGIKNIKFFYPNQTDTNLVKVYPPTIKLLPNGGNDCSIENVFLTNSYYGIDATGPHERLTIKSVKGQPLFGIKIDENYDVDRIDDVHFYPYWSFDISDSTSYASVCLYDGVGIEINRSDNIQISGYFVYGYKHALHLKEGSYGTMNNSSFDFCWRPIQVEDQGININGWYISNTIFISGDYQRGVSGIGINIQGGSGTMGGLHLSNCGFWSGNNGQSNIIGNKGQVVATNCRFNSWLGAQSIYVANDFALQLNGCVFMQTGNHIAYDGSATKGAVVVGTRANGGFTVYNPNSLAQATAANATL